ncbi:MAG: polysaccharide deacetylase family protein [Patescibacteria group bacterium]
MSVRIAYVSIINLRSSRAHVHNSLKTCEALQSSDAAVTFLHPGTRPSYLEDILTSHRVGTRFAFKFCNAVEAEELMIPNRFERGLAYLRMYVGIWSFLSGHADEFDVLYYRHHVLVPLALMWRMLKRKNVFFESHYVYLHKYFSQALTRLAVHASTGVIFITDALRKHYGLSGVKGIIAPCHASECELLPDASVSELRSELNLPLNAKLLCYTGTLGSTIQGISYEVETMIKILSELSSEYQSLIVGDKKNSDYLIKLADKLGVKDRLIIRPWSDRKTVYKYLSASDVLLMPRVGTAPGSSPSKMFDYLAVGKPIVAAKTPPVSEVLFDGKNALLVNADVPQEWAEAIKRLMRDDVFRLQIEEGAKKDGLKYTWSNRGKRINWFISGLKNVNRTGIPRRFAASLAGAFLGLAGKLKLKVFGTRSSVVLAYHSVSESPWVHAVNPDVFREQMMWLKNHAEIVSLDVLQKNLTYKGMLRKKPLAAITFDDGYKDWLENAVPILVELKLAATFFVTTSFVSVTTLPQAGLGAIKPADVSDLAQEGFEIGGHGHTHTDLSACDGAAFRFEILESKKILESLTEQKVLRMSYPKGRYSSKHFEALAEPGYTAAFAGHGPMRPDDSAYALARLPVYKNHDERKFVGRFYMTLLNALG